MTRPPRRSWSPRLRLRHWRPRSDPKAPDSRRRQPLPDQRRLRFWSPWNHSVVASRSITSHKPWTELRGDDYQRPIRCRPPRTHRCRPAGESKIGVDHPYRTSTGSPLQKYRPSIHGMAVRAVKVMRRGRGNRSTSNVLHDPRRIADRLAQRSGCAMCSAWNSSTASIRPGAGGLQRRTLALSHGERPGVGR